MTQSLKDITLSSELHPIPLGTSGIKALSHTPVYRMHRYFARRPYNVFNHLIDTFSNVGEIILDPFCGGGTTVVEGLRLKRKVIGVDLNPLAIFITKNEAIDLDFQILHDIFRQLEENLAGNITSLYQTNCRICDSETAYFNWVAWANTFKCPNCSRIVTANGESKIKPGEFYCKHCDSRFKSHQAEKANDVSEKGEILCSNCGCKNQHSLNLTDAKKLDHLKKNFGRIIKKNKLWYPQELMPMNFELRRPYNYSAKRFVDLLTHRNLLAASFLFDEIKNIHIDKYRYFMLHIFTATLAWVTKMSVDPGHGWAIHAFWLPNQYYELNVWQQFKKRFEWGLRGKQYSQKEIGSYYKECKSFSSLVRRGTCLLLNRTSDNLPLPNNSIDAIITDPPYGGNVMYSELCNFWNVWIQKLEGRKGLINSRKEAIVSSSQKKGYPEYEKLLTGIFKECKRVLKPKHWLVLTFNNKDDAVWEALFNALSSAGFAVDGSRMVFQEPIEHYTQTLYQRRKGAVLGDYIICAQKET